MRMKLHKVSMYGDYEIYPIYEIPNYQGLIALTGYTSRYSNDSISSKAYKTRYFQVVNNRVGEYISNNIPIKEDSEGNILPKFLRYNNIINGRYYVEQDVLSGFSGVQQAVRPDDWGTNPHYLQLQNGDWGMNTPDGYQTVYLNMPLPVSKYDTYDSSATYYLDEDRTLLRMFFTDEGNSFTASKIPVYSSYPRYNPRQYMCGMSISGTPHQQPNYAYTGSNNNLFFGNADVYALSYNGGITGVSTPSTDRNMWTAGFNCPMFFVHYNDNGTDFYGVALVQMSDFTDNAYPIAIAVNVWDSTFWGTSIISGGESGQGTWGNNNVANISEGTFSRRSENVTRDDTDINSSTSIVNGINNRIKGLYSINAYTIYRLTTSTVGFEHSQVPNIIKILFSENFWTNWANKLYNPISTVLSFGYIPSEFVPFQSDMPVKRLTLGGYDVSQHIRDEISGVVAVPEFNTQRPIALHQFNEIDLQKYFDGYADFEPFTKCILHLPFIGNVKLDTNKIAHGKLGVEYICDVATGNVIANIWTYDYEGKSQYTMSASGNCLYSLPLFASSQDGSSIGKIAVGVGILSAGILTQNPGLAISGAMSASSGAVDFGTSLFNREISSAGALGGNNVLISPKQVWLEIIRPNWIENMHYQLLNGIPAEMSNCLADCGQDINSGVPYSGYIVVSEIELDDVNCTDSERSEIAALLQAGVFIRGDELLE